MAININLLPDIKTEERKKKVLVKKVNLVTILILSLVGAATFVIFTIDKITAANLKDLEEDVAKQEKVIDEELETEQALYALKGHSKSIDSILSKRKNFSVLLSKLSNYIPQSIKISDMSITEDGTVSLNGEAPTYEKVSGFELLLSGRQTTDEDIDPEHIFSDIQLNSVSRSDLGGFVRFSITFKAKEGAFEDE